MLKIELRGDRALIAKLDQAADSGVQRELIKEVTASVLLLERHIKANKLSGQVLHVRSGDLRRSVHAVLPVEVSGSAVIGRVAQSGDVKYGAIHEFGGRTSPHVIEAKNALALKFTVGGREIFRRKVNHPGSQMPERSFMRSALADLRQQIIERLRGAVLRGMGGR